MSLKLNAILKLFAALRQSVQDGTSIAHAKKELFWDLEGDLNFTFITRGTHWKKVFFETI